MINNFSALKARHRAGAFQTSSLLQSFVIFAKLRGALPQAVTFRAVGAEVYSTRIPSDCIQVCCLKNDATSNTDL